MLGFEVAQSTVSKYIVRPSKPPSQTWKTFLRNHAEAIAAIDMCVVPTLTFELLFAFLVLGGRRQLLWFEVTRHPTAEWLARQITEASGRPATAVVVRGDTASDSRVAGPADYRGVSLDLGASLPSSRQRPRLWTCLHVSGAGDRHPRSTNLSWVAMAEWLR
jgi:hypothetical protein